MAFSASSSSSYCFFTSPNFTLNRQQSTSVRYYGKPNNSRPISAKFATARARSESSASNTARSPRIATPSSLYEVLGVQPGADTVEIKAAYRRLARVLHPDVRNQDSSADEFMRLHSAYATLSDPGKRADYDRSLLVTQKLGVRTSSSAGYSGYSGRRWETDSAGSVCG